jgi:hypothetical protein
MTKNEKEHQQRREARRRAIAGYPKEFVFTEPEDLDDYFSGEKITCLRCGKEYKSIGVHLKTIHGMEPDEYRDIYGIPWTRGLVCATTKENYAEIAKKNIADGVFTPSAEQASLARKSLKKQRNRQPVRETYTQRNLEEMNKNATGEDKARKEKMSKKGSEEYTEKMRQLPQCNPEEAGKRLGDYWRGRSQSDEHLYKRTGYRRK